MFTIRLSGGAFRLAECNCITAKLLTPRRADRYTLTAPSLSIGPGGGFQSGREAVNLLAQEAVNLLAQAVVNQLGRAVAER